MNLFSKDLIFKKKKIVLTFKTVGPDISKLIPILCLVPLL